MLRVMDSFLENLSRTLATHGAPFKGTPYVGAKDISLRRCKGYRVTNLHHLHIKLYYCDMYHMDTRNSNPASKDSEGPAEFESRGHEDTIGCPLETDLGMRRIPFKPCVEARAAKKYPLCGLGRIPATVASSTAALPFVKRWAETHRLASPPFPATSGGSRAHLAWTSPPPLRGTSPLPPCVGARAAPSE